MKPRYLLSHPTGNQNMRHTALALANAEALAEVWTCVSWNSDSVLADVLPSRIRAQVERRTFPRALQRCLHSRPWLEMARLACRQLGWSNPVRHEHGWCSVDAVYRDLDQHVAARLAEVDGITGVYAYEDAAVESFAAAKHLGLRCIYDLPIGYWRAFNEICEEEEEREPAWAETLIGNLDSAAKHTCKDHELASADHIIVASSFTRATLAHYPGILPPVSVVPYGAPAAVEGERRWSQDGPLRVLYVGSLSQRKGLSYLFTAVATLGTLVSLTIVGARVAACPPLDAALITHRYIPSLPHARILELMREHDVLVFPSLFEGFGLVITEAMSQGMPVITTPHTAGPDLITDGYDGFIVPIRDAPAITEHLRMFAHDRERLAAMGRAALTTIGKRTWNDFHRHLQEAVGLHSSPIQTAFA